MTIATRIRALMPMHIFLIGIALCVIVDIVLNTSSTDGIGRASPWHFVGSVLMALAIWQQWQHPLVRVAAWAGLIVDAVWLWYGDYTTPFAFVLRGNYLLWCGIACTLIWYGARSSRPYFGNRYRDHLFTAVLPVVGLLILSAYSPLTAVYADLYGGGDTWIALGGNGLLLFVAIWGGMQVWQRRSSQAPRWAFSATSSVLAITQAVSNGEWRFVPWVIVSAVLMDVWAWQQLQRHWWSVAVWPPLFCVGYFMTLKYTTILSWNPTVWIGMVVFAMGIGYVLYRFSAPPITQHAGTS